MFLADIYERPVCNPPSPEPISLIERDSPVLMSAAPPVSRAFPNVARLSSRFLGERLLAQFFPRVQKLVTESRAGHRPR